MTRRIAAATVLLVLWSLRVASAQTTCTLFAAQGGTTFPTTSLVTLDPATGAVASTIGPVGFNLTGLVVDPFSGALFGTTAGGGPRQLLRIDRVTGGGTVVGPIGWGAAA